MSAARASLSVSVRRLSIAASIVGCVAGAATMHGQKKGFACDKDNGGLTLPGGFCAGVIADNLGTARNLVVAPNGDIFVSVRSGPTVQGQPPQPGFILGLRDTDGDGKIDLQEKFGTQGATGIRLRNGYLYYATPTSIQVQPKVTLGRNNGWIIHAAAGVSFNGKAVQLQRLNVLTGQWVTLKKVILNSKSSAKVLYKLPKGLNELRVTMSVNQAGAGFLGAISPTVKYRQVT